MKKISILVAAFAMIAFAGCNKEKENQGFTPDENGMVSFTMGAESYGPVAKQAYYAYDQYILFEVGDQCYANGYLANIALIDPATNNEITGDATATSNLGRITVPAAAATTPFTVLYPAGSFVEGTEADYPAWNVPMNNKVYMIPEVSQEGYHINVDYTESTPNWPMAAQLNDFRGTYQLRHAVAILTPQFQFGTTYLTRLAQRISAMANIVPTNIALIPDSIILKSTNRMLSGNSHIDLTNPDEPILVMDGTLPATGDSIIIYPSVSAPSYYMAGVGDNPPTTNMGNFTLAPKPRGQQLNLNMKFYFTLSDGTQLFHCVYNGEAFDVTDTPRNGSVLRGRRTFLGVDLYTAEGARKTTLLSVE
ncbi:MAG: hypothetical protein IJM33_07725 [Bacteroidales bacterium]|nr:hypothetical protein [Bacteroidales bacterium]